MNPERIFQTVCKIVMAPSITPVASSPNRFIRNCAAQIAVREDVAYRIADVCYCRNHLVENDKSSVTEHPAYDFAHLVQIVP